MASREELIRALRWQMEAGADEAIGAEPSDRFAEADGRAVAPEPPAPPSPEPPAPAPPSPAPMATEAPVTVRPPRSAGGAGLFEGGGAASGYEMAAAAATLDELRAALERFEGCPLKRTATNLVLYDGNPKARIVFVGEAPGAEEDRRGLPFVGPAGKLLDRMLEAIGLDRTGVLITNILFWRPPGNRNPTTSEIAACLPFVERIIELVHPAVLVLLGGPSAKTLLAQNEGIMKLRGRWFHFETPRMARPIPAMATYHPAFLLRSPGQKRAVWRDLLEIRRRLAAETGSDA